jgi:hypothetical protein
MPAYPSNSQTVVPPTPVAQYGANTTLVGIQTPELLVENVGNQPISLALIVTRNGADAICARDTVPSSIVRRYRACDGALRIFMHNGREVRAYPVSAGAIYAIYWNGQVWDIKSVDDRG